jgi:hypothetical protein
MVGHCALTLTPLIQAIYFMLAIMFGYMFFASNTGPLGRNININMPFGDAQKIELFLVPGRIILGLVSVVMLCYAAGILG